MNRNLFLSVRFLTRNVLLVCTDAMKQESLFLPCTDSKYAVCSDEKRMEKVFRRFCRFIIMFESGVIFELNKFAYVG